MTHSVRTIYCYAGKVLCLSQACFLHAVVFCAGLLKPSALVGRGQITLLLGDLLMSVSVISLAASLGHLFTLWRNSLMYTGGGRFIDKVNDINLVEKVGSSTLLFMHQVI